MGNDIQSGHTYTDTSDGRVVDVDNLNRHVNEAVIKETFISAKTLKNPPALSDAIVLSDNALKKTTLQHIKELYQPDGFLTADTAGRAKMADGYIIGSKIADSVDISGKTDFNLPPGAIHARGIISSLEDADEFLFFDSSANEGDGGLAKISRASMVAALQPVGSVLQTVQSVYSDLNSTSVVFPCDTSVPQSNEGIEVMTATITPLSTSNKILISATLSGTCNAIIFYGLGIFRNSEAGAIAARFGVGNYDTGIHLEYLDSPATTSAITYKMRAGPNSNSLNINGTADATHLFGGVSRCTLTIQEIKG